MQRDPEWDGGQHQGAGGQGDGGDQAEEQAADHHAGSREFVVENGKRMPMHRFVCSSLFRSSSISPPKPASRWGNPRGSLMSRSSSHFLSWVYSHARTHRLKIWTMRSGRQTASSNNFSLSTSLHSSKLESSHHLSVYFSIVFFIFTLPTFYPPQSWVISVGKGCFRIHPSHLTWHLLSATTRMYENTTLFFGDIVGFTKLTAQRWSRSAYWWQKKKTDSCRWPLFCCSTATQTIQFLNDLYNKFDKAIDNYDVYKVWWGTEWHI